MAPDSELTDRPAPVLGGHDLESERLLREADLTVAIVLGAHTTRDSGTSDDQSHGQEQQRPPPSARTTDLDRNGRDPIRHPIDAVPDAVGPSRWCRRGVLLRLSPTLTHGPVPHPRRRWCVGGLHRVMRRCGSCTHQDRIWTTKQVEIPGSCQAAIAKDQERSWWLADPTSGIELSTTVSVFEPGPARCSAPMAGERAWKAALCLLDRGQYRGVRRAQSAFPWCRRRRSSRRTCRRVDGPATRQRLPIRRHEAEPGRPAAALRTRRRRGGSGVARRCDPRATTTSRVPSTSRQDAEVATHQPRRGVTVRWDRWGVPYIEGDIRTRRGVRRGLVDHGRPGPGRRAVAGDRQTRRPGAGHHRPVRSAEPTGRRIDYTDDELEAGLRTLEAEAPDASRGDPR